VIAGGESGHAGAHLAHDARAFMTADYGQRAFAQSFDDREVRVAESCATNFDEHFAGTRAVEFDLLDPERLAIGIGRGKPLFIHDRSSHFHCRAPFG
jgi:hypothetical protein